MTFDVLGEPYTVETLELEDETGRIPVWTRGAEIIPVKRVWHSKDGNPPAAALQMIGIYVASSLFIGIFMWLVGKFGPLRSAITGIGVSLVLFWIFEIMFTVPLPKGPLEQMFGY